MNAYADLHSFIVDPQRDGIDNALWHNVTGTPTVSGGKFRFNTQEALVRADLMYGRIEFPVTMPLSAVNTIEAVVFSGTGLNDATSGGTYTDGIVAATYVVTIDTAAATDKFTWTKNGVTMATGVAITTSAQDLDEGVTITFAAATGHTLAESWTINVTINSAGDLVNDIEFGLKNLSLGNISKIQVLADKSEDAFLFKTYDRNGITAQSTTIQWQGEWNSAVARFVIDWFIDRVRLSVVNAGTETEITLAEHKTKVGQHPLNPYVKVVGAENLDVNYIAVEKAKGSSLMLI